MRTARTGAAVGVLAVLLAGAVGGCAVPRPPAQDPLTAEERNDLGVAYHARGDYAAAAREFTRALASRPEWTRALVNLADAQLALGDLARAIATYQRARAMRPRDPAILNNLAWALLHHPERWPEAGPLIEDALEQAPERPGYYLDTLGVLRLRQGAAADALAAFRAALSDPQLPAATRGLVRGHAGEALLHLGDLAGAERCFRAAGLGGGPDGRAPAGEGSGEVGRRDPVC